MAVDTPATVFSDDGRRIDPMDAKTWPEEAQRNHRLRRALHELMPVSSYHVEVGTRPDGSAGIRIVPAESASTEALEFLRQYREELITHHYWLEQVDDYHGVDGNPPAWNRKRVA